MLLLIGFSTASNVANSHLFFKNGICGVNLRNNSIAIVNTASEGIDVTLPLSNNVENADPSVLCLYMVGLKISILLARLVSFLAP